MITIPIAEFLALTLSKLNSEGDHLLHYRQTDKKALLFTANNLMIAHVSFLRATGALTHATYDLTDVYRYIYKVGRKPLLKRNKFVELYPDEHLLNLDGITFDILDAYDTVMPDILDIINLPVTPIDNIVVTRFRFEAVMRMLKVLSGTSIGFHNLADVATRITFGGINHFSVTLLHEECTAKANHTPLLYEETLWS